MHSRLSLLCLEDFGCNSLIVVHGGGFPWFRQDLSVCNNQRSSNSTFSNPPLYYVCVAIKANKQSSVEPCIGWWLITQLVLTRTWGIVCPIQAIICVQVCCIAHKECFICTLNAWYHLSSKGKGMLYITGNKALRCGPKPNIALFLLIFVSRPHPCALFLVMHSQQW